MPDGSERTFRPWWGTRICENGSYFCKRDRNKAGTVGIYTCKGRQTVRVGETDECAPEEAIDEAKLGRIELALGRFVLSNVEAAARERDGVRKTDMSVRDVLNIYALARDGFHEEVIRKLEERLATALAQKSEVAAALPFQIKQARRARGNERSVLAMVITAVEATWKETTIPRVSELTQSNQTLLVKWFRATGYADNSIRNYLTRLFTALNYCYGEGRLLYSPPECIKYEKWGIVTDENEDVIVFELHELAALFNAAAEHEPWWKYMNLATSGARPMTLLEATWLQVSAEPPLWDLNPPGKRRTKKRRPTIPLCLTLAAELASWPRDAVRIVTDGRGRAMGDIKMFKRIQRKAGVTRGTAMSMRKTIRMWLMLNNVPEAVADLFVGHADEGSATGRKFYKSKMPQYMAQAAAAIQKLYDALQPLVKRPFAGAALSLVEDQPLPGQALFGDLRGNCVTEVRAS